MRNVATKQPGWVEAINRQPFAILTAFAILAVLHQVSELITFVSFEMIPFFSSILEFYSSFSAQLWGIIFSFIELEIPQIFSMYLTTGLIVFGMTMRQIFVLFRINRCINIVYIIPSTNIKLFNFHTHRVWGIFMYMPLSIIVNMIFWPITFITKVWIYFGGLEAELTKLATEYYSSEIFYPLDPKITRVGNRVFIESLAWAILMILISFAVDQIS